MISKENKIVLGSDHYGLLLKNQIKSYLTGLGYQTDDLGVNSEEPVDYPLIGIKVAKAVGSGDYENGILFCGTGAGMAIVANKIPGVRAVCVADPYTAERARASNNANLITMGSQVTGTEVAKKLIDIWLASEFQGGRSASKVAKIDQLDTEIRQA